MYILLKKFTFLFIVLLGIALYGDTIILKDETLLVGKVKSKNRETIVFKNSYGAFKIKRDQIKRLYETKSYREDIAIRKKLGLDFNVNDIRKNYSEGVKKLTKIEVKKLNIAETGPKEKKIPMNNIRVEPVFFYTLGELDSTVPYGLGGLASYSRKLNDLFFNEISLESGYITYSKDEYTLNVITASIGPIFRFQAGKSGNGDIMLAVAPGISYLDISNSEESATTLSFTTHSFIGYEYSFESFALYLKIRHLYINDKDVFFHSIGSSVGINFKF